MNFNRLALSGALALAIFSMWSSADERPPAEARRSDSQKALSSGNYKLAYDGLRELALDPKDDRLKVANDLQTGISALEQLGRIDEIDDFREAVIKVHGANWLLLDAAAQSYITVVHQGFIVAGKFYRGGRRGGGKYVNAANRDRVRALQLMQAALPIAIKDEDRTAVAKLHLRFAGTLLAEGGFHEAWRLQSLSNLRQLPDYDEGYVGYGGTNLGAPVDAAGNPVVYSVPKSYEAAQSDGERWRWLLSQAVEIDQALLNEAQLTLANFLRSQFGVQTLARFGVWGGGIGEALDETSKDDSGTFALHTLSDEETIARLATGIKRFRLADEFNFIKLYQQIASRNKSPLVDQALDALAQIFEDRRQYVKAAAAWKRAIATDRPQDNDYRKTRLEQVVGNWGRFETAQTQPAGKGATVDFRYRNATQASFEAWEVDTAKLLTDVKDYLKSSPRQLDWSKLNIADIGSRLVQQNETQYIGPRVASWELTLKPRANHVDDRVTVATPLQKPGAYLVTAKLPGGNVSRIILWVADTVIVKKQLADKSYFYVADAVSGMPVPKATIEYLGWKQIQVQPNKNDYKVVTTNFAELTDKDGQVLVDQKHLPQDHQWLIIVRSEGGRFAYLGFTGVWYNRSQDELYNQTKVFTITDRPVYRPEQVVKFKFWIEHARYDQTDTSEFGNRQFTVQINNPKGEKTFEKVFTTDEYGGIDGECPLPKGSALGVYQLLIANQGGGNFRVEEYKKPEFEVRVEAPKEPITLGEKIQVTIQAKYFFGAPVTKAKVKYKVLRSSHNGTWHPAGPWDWFYGRGYWWFAADYAWFPGWKDWGCRRPIPEWWRRPQQPPEVIVENEVPVGEDGIVRVEIDTLPAKELHGDSDHQYSITAEVVDESRRTIVGTGNVLVARKPFKVFAWVERGYYRVGDDVEAHFQAHTLDQKPVPGKGVMTLYGISYNDKNEPVEKAVENWNLDTDERGHARQQFKAAQKGQYRLSYKLTDSQGHTIEGGYVFVVRGEGFDGHEFRFNDIELITDKREYAAGETVKLMINTNRAGGTVVLFLRPSNGIYLAPKIIRLDGKSTVEEVAIGQKDMPNFFIEAFTIASGRLHTELREVVVPPEKRVVNVSVLPSQEEYRPGAPAKVRLQLSDSTGKPFVGSIVLSIYDKSLEYISGGSNVAEIREFFWKWRRMHRPHTESTLDRWFFNLLKSGEIAMANLGVFGDQVVEEMRNAAMPQAMLSRQKSSRGMAAPAGAAHAVGGVARLDKSDKAAASFEAGVEEQAASGAGPALIQPTVRKNFADTAFWAAAILTDRDGKAEIALDMPENLTGWKVKAWALGHGTKVGQGEAEIVTRKNLLVRLQAPRFFVETDEVVLSANVHNYLKTAKPVDVSLELESGNLAALDNLTQKVTIDANGEQRVDWRVKVVGEGTCVIRMKALTDEESDAIEMRFPAYVHGMHKVESFSGAIRPGKESSALAFTVPAARRINDSRLEVRYSPTLAGAMVDALPYLVEYPYGCTEQTLNRFLPTVVTHSILRRMNLNLKDIQEKRTNLNAQELGDDKERAASWKRYVRNPVFDADEVTRMTTDGLQALTSMQLSDGGWGWFSGFGERSWPHTTALVVHGLQMTKPLDVAIVPGVLERGIAWLKAYDERQVELLKNAADKKANKEWKESADNLDAFIFMVLVDADVAQNDMLEFLYRDRTKLSAYAKAMYGLALDKLKQPEKLAMILENLDQFVVQDDENQTAYLKLPEGSAWWYWYGSETEANGYYLKLLARTSPREERTSRLVKYLLNNRQHGTYWNSTRDTAICIEALAEYMTASGEDKPDMSLEIWYDGKRQKEVKIDKSNLFTFDNKFVLFGDAVETGKHTLELRRKGVGPVYFNAYLTSFTLEDFITKAGLEVQVNRKYYKLKKVDKKIKVAGAAGQALDQKVEKYEREELANLATVKSGDLVEIELEIDSKNDYEYLLFEDMKASGFEPVDVRSGYGGNGLGAYLELRDEKVCFFVRWLARGKHSIAYRMKAEIPGKFSALPTKASAMYAPELKGNSDEIKLVIED